jgi:hypothetical protein
VKLSMVRGCGYGEVMGGRGGEESATRAVLWCMSPV